jgi:hypothetical protein
MPPPRAARDTTVASATPTPPAGAPRGAVMLGAIVTRCSRFSAVNVCGVDFAMNADW